eukprot:3359679-Alexandrium_andersonii.AAC.1
MCPCLREALARGTPQGLGHVGAWARHLPTGRGTGGTARLAGIGRRTAKPAKRQNKRWQRVEFVPTEGG